ncbi:MAG: hypothetical protein JXA30_16635 [Deltaproteobacteria bacterium]|nr:hypothetical protein [Deltaproteobacteria bacterium]
MALNTAAAAISFARKLEEDAARFYEAVAEKYNSEEATYLTFAKENQKHIAQVERTYYGVISDALEGCFSFAMDTEEYAFSSELADRTEYALALETAIDIESKTARFYTQAARQSKALMADVPRVFDLTAKKHNKRIERLEELRPT